MYTTSATNINVVVKCLERGGKPGVPGITEGSEFQTMDSWQTISFWIERSTCRRVSLINLRLSACKSFRVWYFQTPLRNYYTWCLRKAQWLIWLTYASQVILRESSYLTWVKLSYVSHAILRESSSSRRTYVRNYIVFSKNDVSHAILRESSCLAWIKLSYVSQVILLYVCTQLGWLTRTYWRLFLPRGIICLLVSESFLALSISYCVSCTSNGNG